MNTYKSTSIDIGMLNVILIEIKSDQTIAMINPKGCAILGCDKNEIIGKNWFDTFIPEADRKNIKNVFDQLMSGQLKNIDYFENEIITFAGQHKLIAWHNSFQCDDKGAITGILSIGEDITTKSSIELAIREERDKAQLYLDIADVIIMVTDNNQNITQINLKGCYFFGLPESRLIGKSLKDYFSEDSVNALRARLVLASNNPTMDSFYSENDLITPDHVHYLIAWHHKLLITHNNQITGMISSGIDISSQRRAEDLLRMQRDLAVMLSNTTFQSNELYETFMDMLLSIHGIDQVGLYLFDQNKNKLILKSMKPSVEIVETISFNDTIHRDYIELIHGGQTIHLNQQSLKRKLPNEKVRSIIVIPIKFEKQLIAVLNIASMHFDHFDDDVLNTLHSLSAQLGNAIIQIDARHALKQSEALNRNILENIGIGMVLLDQDYKVVKTNRQMRLWFPGFTGTAHPLCARTDASGDTDTTNNFPGMRSLQTGQRHESVLTYESDNQGKRYFRTVSTALYNNNETAIVGTVELIEEVTQKMKIDEAMQNMHMRTTQILTSIPSILIGINNRQQISEWNSAAEQAFNIPKSQAFNHDFATLPIPWENHRQIVSFKDALDNNNEIKFSSIKYKQVDGREGFLDITITRMMGTGKIFSEFLLIANDITENKALETHLLQSQKLESIGQLSAGIAHEINTPIQYVGDNIRFLDESFEDFRKLITAFQVCYNNYNTNTLTEEQITKLKLIMDDIDIDYLLEEIPSAVNQSLEGVERVATIVRALKGFAHPDDAKEKKKIDINQAIKNTITVARNEWKYVAEIQTVFDDTLPMVDCYTGEFNQVILNLIVNAAHAIGDKIQDTADQKGSIIISTEGYNNEVRITIRDSGNGIPDEIKDKVFDPFFTTKEVGRGTGQGLAIARSVIVDKHGGKLTFETVPGDGTTFYIILPINLADEDR